MPSASGGQVSRFRVQLKGAVAVGLDSGTVDRAFSSQECAWEGSGVQRFGPDAAPGNDSVDDLFAGSAGHAAADLGSPGRLAASPELDAGAEHVRGGGRLAVVTTWPQRRGAER